MADQKRILVFGATGAQGGSVARHLLERGDVSVRCITRKPESEAARALRAAGAELVAGDLDDRASIEPAMRGCWGVFGVTNFWEHFGKEEQHGRNLCDAVAASDVQCFIFSTLKSLKDLSGGKLEVPHTDIKQQLEHYARDCNLPVIFAHVAYYYENFLTFFKPQRQDDGSYAFGFPQGDTPLAAYSVEDTGGVVGALFRQPQPFMGQTVGVVGDDRPPAEYADSMARATGERIRYNHISRDVYASFGFPGAEDLANMFDVQRRYVPNRKADLELSRRLYPHMQTFDQWAQTHSDQLRRALSS
jgi:uncharacterized protein YbjT (DUF2867 family)